jgi:hypothetical protein
VPTQLEVLQSRWEVLLRQLEVPRILLEEVPRILLEEVPRILLEEVPRILLEEVPRIPLEEVPLQVEWQPIQLELPKQRMLPQRAVQLMRPEPESLNLQLVKEPEPLRYWAEEQRLMKQPLAEPKLRPAAMQPRNPLLARRKMPVAETRELGRLVGAWIGDEETGREAGPGLVRTALGSLDYLHFGLRFRRRG